MKEELEWVRQKAPRPASPNPRPVCNALKKCSRSRIPEAQRNQRDLHPAGPRLGDKVIEFKNVTKSYGDRVLIDNLSFAMPPGAIVGVIGP